MAKKKRKKIALVVPNLTGGGGGVCAVAKFVKDTISRDNELDLEVISLSTSATDPTSVRLAAPSTWLRGVCSQQGTWEGLPFLHIGAFAGEIEFQRYRRRQLLSKSLAHVDLIQVVSGSAAFANTVLGLGKPVALQVATRARVERHIRDRSPDGAVGVWRKAMTEITDRLDDRALRRVNSIQVENPWMLEYAHAINAGRDVDLRYAPPGINAELFHPREDRLSLRDRYILCVARLSDPRKRIGLLLEAYAGLPARLQSEVRLVVAGSTAPPDSFWRHAQQLGLRERISYIANADISALIGLYQGASVFALPSDEEGLGVVILEAMACGVPVVSTRSGGPDGIITDGVDGFLVPLDDADSMSQRLAQLLQTPSLNIEMGSQARMTIQRRYDERVAGKVFVDMWERAIGRDANR